MAKTEHYFTRFEPGKCYHVYNRTIDKKSMFKNGGNYEFFLRKYQHYICPVADTYAYCLLGNHFHLLIKILDWDADLTTFGKLSNLSPAKPPHEIISHQFRKFFQSYAMAFNKQQDRVGTLFQTPFKRALITDDDYFTHLILYIHLNPQLHGLTNDFKKWPWSSYNKILSEKPVFVKKSDVLKWFGEREQFIQYHQHDFENLSDNWEISLEDD